MTQTQACGYHLLRSLLISGVLLASPFPAMAQRIPVADDTLGDERSIVSPDEVIRDVPSNRIDGGARRGANLFHSFREFNIDEGRGAYFTDPDGVANIITRVTGGSRSDILGTLGVLGDANLFLINPSGIVFGPNASLDIGGSFISSTADGFVFDNGFTFSAADPQAPPLLTVSVPIGLQYGSNPGAIQVQQSLLQVPDGQTLTLAGGTVDVDGAGLYAFGGRVELAGIAAPGEVGLTQQGQEWRLSVPEGLSRADVEIGNNAFVDVRSGGGGSIAITARNFTGTGASTGLRAGIATGLGNAGAQAGDIDINTTGAINLDASTVENIVVGTGNAGDINTTVGSLSLTNGAYFDTTLYGQGNAGNINITASDVVSFDGEGTVVTGTYSSVYPEAIGQSGDINITSGTLSLTNGGYVEASTYGQGDAGDITIVARDSVSFDGESSDGFFSGVSSVVAPGAIGQGGNVSITTGNLTFTNGAGTGANTFGQGDAGNVTITASDRVFFDGMGRNRRGTSGAYSTVEAGAIGQGGNVSITTGNLTFTNGGRAVASTLGQGDAGNVTITAHDRIFFDGVNSNGVPSGAYSTVEAGAIGQGGNVSITTGNLIFTNGAGAFTTTFGQGDAGNVTITASDRIFFDGEYSNSDGGAIASGAFSTVEAGAIGQGGDINITTGSLSLTNGAVVNVGTVGWGDAGNITIRARDTVFFDGVDNKGLGSGALSLVYPEAIGQGGNIRINADRLSITNGAEVNAAASGQGRAGNITFNTSRLLVAGNAQVLAQTSSTGNGGSIVINAPISVNLRRTNNLSPVLSVETSGAGQAGDITINTPSLTLAEQARITATATATATNPQGGGSITLNASDLNLAGIVGVFAETQGEAPAGTLRLNPYNNQPDLEITLTPRSQISASTSGSGNGGDLIVTAPESISITGAGRLAVETSSAGNAGNMQFTTQHLNLNDGVEISASTSGSGQAGDIGINAQEFTLSGGAQVSTNTSSSGQAGDLTVQVSDRLLLTGAGTGLFASTTTDSRGNGGNIAIDPNLVQIEEGASIAVDSQGRGTGGNISLQADQLLLDRGSITAETDSAQGGNIALDVADLTLLRHNSLISATAGTAQAGGDGGNISIDSPFLVTYPNENSDISANAFSGRGGNVEITAQSLFGIEARTQPTPQSDITASSESGVAGVVSINTPDVDPNRGLVQLPADVTDASRLIVQSCPVGNGSNRQQNEFIVTGRGGLPPTPDEAVNPDAIQVDLVTTEAEAESSVSQQEPEQNRPPIRPRRSAGAPIVEAQGWQVGADGKVMLVATAPENASNAAGPQRIAPSSNRQIHCR